MRLPHGAPSHRELAAPGVDLRVDLRRSSSAATTPRVRSLPWPSRSVHANYEALVGAQELVLFSVMQHGVSFLSRD